MDMLSQKQKIIAVVFIIIAIGVMIFQYINSTKEAYSYESLNVFDEQAEDKKIAETKEEKIIVHVTGAVKKNGIVEVKENARINDVIEAAGGVTKDADLTNVNLAYIVEDGQKIYIPSKQDMIESKEINENKQKEIISEGAGDKVTGKIGGVSKTNINKANLEGLKVLPGVGESTALKILEYRETHGKFKSIEDIKNVSGIGDGKFNSIKDLICIWKEKLCGFPNILDTN